MKSKTTMWILIPAVLAIWGAIGWQVYAAMNDDDDNVAAKQVSNEPKTSKQIVPDTFSLLLDYPDPFTAQRAKPKVTATRQSQTAVVKSTPISTEQTQWPSIVYSGLVKQPSGGKMLGFLSVNGTSYFVKEGDEVAGVKIVWMGGDKIRIVRNKEQREFFK